MHIQGSQRRIIEKLRSQDLPEGDDDDQLGISFSQELQGSRIIAQTLGLEHRKTGLLGQNLHWRRGQSLSSASRPIRLTHDSYQLKVGIGEIQEGLE